MGFQLSLFVALADLQEVEVWLVEVFGVVDEVFELDGFGVGDVGLPGVGGDGAGFGRGYELGVELEVVICYRFGDLVCELVMVMVMRIENRQMTYSKERGYTQYLPTEAVVPVSSGFRVENIHQSVDMN